MYTPKAIEVAPTALTGALAAIARNHRLVVCIGAGFSVAWPTELPAGAQLARDVHDHIVGQLGALPTCDPDDLTSVADAVATLPGGLELVRRTCLDNADFTTAAPNYAHQTLAMLLLEGLVSALSWNWDTCVERSGLPEQVPAVVTDADRRDFNGPVLLKLHGCAVRPASMLVTTADLREPLAWVEAETKARLTDSVVVFVGIGDVAGYTREHVKAVVEAVGDPNNIYVVAPGLDSDWHESVWSDIVPDLPTDHRVANTAEEFLDALSAATVNQVLLQLVDSSAGQPDLEAAARKVAGVIRDADALSVLRLARASGVRVPSGTACLDSNNGRRALLAVGVVVLDAPTPVLSGSWLQTDDAQVHMLVSPDDRPASDFVRDARRRLLEVRNDGYAGAVVFVCAGTTGPLPTGPTNDILNASEPGDIVAGPQSESPSLKSAAALIGAA